MENEKEPGKKISSMAELCEKHGIPHSNTTKEHLGKTSIIPVPKTTTKPEAHKENNEDEPEDDSAETMLHYMNLRKGR